MVCIEYEYDGISSACITFCVGVSSRVRVVYRWLDDYITQANPFDGRQQMHCVYVYTTSHQKTESIKGTL